MPCSKVEEATIRQFRRKTRTKLGVQNHSQLCIILAICPSLLTIWNLQGQGIFAARDIPKGTFVHEYLGELYSPWRWFEKQDWLRKNNPNQALPDFYNISLERPKDLPGGADVIFVEVG